MDSIQKQETPPLEIWLPDIQSYLSRTVRHTLQNTHLHFNRSNFTFRRNERKHSAEIGFVFVSQFPVNYRISFFLQVWHPKILRIKQEYMKSILQKDTGICSLSVQMKDFTRAESGDHAAKDITIYSQKELFFACEEIDRLLTGSVLPLLDKVSSISAMDEYFTIHPNWSVNTHSGGNTCTDLITAYLIRHRDFRQVYHQLKEQIRRKIEERKMTSESIELLDLCYGSLQK